MDPLEKAQKEKIVFYLHKKQSIGGGLVFYMNLASAIAELGKYKAYYINIPNADLESRYLNDHIECLDIHNCDLSELEGASFVVPLNYIFDFLTFAQEVRYGRILLFDWQPQQVDFLAAQFPTKRRNICSLLEMFNSRHAVVFMDESCRFSGNRWLANGFEPSYVPVFPAEVTNIPPCYEIRGKKRISIGWMSRLDSDKIQSLINLLEAIKNSQDINEVDLHIIGDGNQKGKINLARYAGKIRFVFTSYLYGEERDSYFQENIDIAVTMGISALDTSRLGIPTVIPIVQMKPFAGDQFVFPYDAAGFSLGWTKDDLASLGYQTYTIGEVVKMVYQENGKEHLGNACRQYCTENFDLANSAGLLIDAIKNSKLTIQDCREHPIAAKQLAGFKRYQMFHRRSRPDYLTYILFVQKLNRFGKEKIRKKIRIIFTASLSFAKEKTKQLLGKVIQKLKKPLLKKKQLKYYMKVQKSYSAKIERISDYYFVEKKLKVLFLVIFGSVFPSRPVFEKMLQDDTFDPYIMVIPDMQRSSDHKIMTLSETFDELSRCYGERVICGYDYKSDTYQKPDDDVKIVFFNNPYSRMAHKYHHVTYFLNKDVLPIYINYGFAAVKYGRIIMETDFYNLCWKVCLDSMINLDDLKEHQAIKGKNAFVTSYLKMDRYAQAAVYTRTRKTIIISPHHTVAGWKSLDISNFISYSDFFLELPLLYPNIDFVFRPHPLLFDNLLAYKMWSQEKINAYLNQIEAIPNMRYDHSGDYFELFANSDGIVHDCSSFIGEYLFTEKPCCYMLKNEQEIQDVMNPMGIACMENYYKAYGKDDILRFIDEVILKGIDPLKEQREEFSRKILKFNYPHSAEAVIRMLKESIRCGGNGISEGSKHSTDFVWRNRDTNADGQSAETVSCGAGTPHLGLLPVHVSES